MQDKILKQLHNELALKLLKKVKDPDATASELNVARQFLRDNNIDCVPVEGSSLQRLAEELPFEIPTKPEITH